MINQQIKEYLEKKHVKYATINHPTAYTASQTAQAAHIPGKQMIKVVVIKADEKLAIVALPAHENIDINALRKLTKAKKVVLAHEYEFNEQFPGCDVGAMPPFGELFKMEVYMAESLTKQNWLACNAGSHSDLLKIKGDEFLKLVHPKPIPNC